MKDGWKVLRMNLIMLKNTVCKQRIQFVVLMKLLGLKI